MKVALVCQFSNAKVREYLPLGGRRVYSLVRKVMGLPSKSRGYGDVAGWNTYMIELLRKREDIDLTVISAHSGLRKSLTSFELDGVHYNFVRIEGATLLKHLIHSPSLWHELNPVRPRVRKIIGRVKPDVIALIGAENPHISGTVLGIEGIPLFVKCQTIYNNPDWVKSGKVDAKNAFVERLIFKDLQYVAVGTGMHCRLFRAMNQKAFNFRWPLGNLLPEVRPLEKVYDFVNFAMSMSSHKGFPDAIQALAVIKKDFPEVQLNLIGRCTEEEKRQLVCLVENLGLSANVTFTPFFKCQEDLFQHLQLARFAVLPCKLDAVSSTVRQAMHYQLPVVCYKTGGTPILNQDKECVLIAENGNIEDLARKMLLLLQNKEMAEELKLNAKEYSRRWNDDEGNLRQMADTLHAVVEHYRFGTSIPERLLYDEKR